jgi:hypothetical protein
MEGQFDSTGMVALRLERPEDYDVVLFGALDEARPLEHRRDKRRELERISSELLETLQRAASRGIEPVHELVGSEADLVRGAIEVFVERKLASSLESSLDCILVAEALDLLATWEPSPGDAPAT